MCGIVGYAGYREAQPVIFDCLSKLEYRGYDSCGIAVCGAQLNIIKEAVRVEALQQKAARLAGKTGIGHTRWATHGEPTARNAHPHPDCSGRIAVVHNGIITNYQKLRQQLMAEGHLFLSETDTEVISHLVEKYFKGDLIKAVKDALKEVQGSYAVAVVMEGNECLVVSRKDSPLIIGVGNGENLIASDVAAVLSYTNRVIFLEDGDTASVLKGDIKIWDEEGQVNRSIHEVNWNKSQVQKNGYDHFMLKEIHEQPRVIRDTLDPINDLLSGDNPLRTEANLNDLLLLACGTSHNASLIGKYLIEELLGIPVRVELASEFNHRNRLIVPSLAIAITQSGETADVLIPLRKLKSSKAIKLVITNVLGSSASRLSDYTIYTKAGPEVSVAATKTFMAQIIELYRLVFSSNLIDQKIAKVGMSELNRLPELVERLLENEKCVAEAAGFLSKHTTVFYLGRGINYPVALEGALKLKEISYIHAEGYAAGELKHGPFALLDKNTPVVILIAQDGTYDSMLSNLKEVNARKSPIIAIADEDNQEIERLADMVIRVPHVAPIISPVVNTVAVQLIAYFTARSLGCDIDFPRNLAKSVTVE
jgi:glutamine---fructose-6-phosphate transaminase (isomerizing)